MPLNWKRDKDDVMLDPQIIRHARRVLKFKPGVDIFASDFHHQLPKYYALEADPNAAKWYSNFGHTSVPQGI